MIACERGGDEAVPLWLSCSLCVTHTRLAAFAKVRVNSRHLMVNIYLCYTLVQGSRGMESRPVGLIAYHVLGLSQG